MIDYDFVKVPIVDIVNQIILFAAQHRASDIHFDPLGDALMVRMRFDGSLQNHSLVPKVYERNLITRIKLVAGMNITETRLPQDGAIKGRIGGRDLDMRVSILPTNEGEKCVIRILDFQEGLRNLDGLGFTPSNYEKIEKMLSSPNGIILVTGATGAGKSTTTYSMLTALNKEETNIITIEDPIEMNIEGVNQVQVNSEIGMTFGAALRSILRQDPNVILVGEMRDEETAQIAVRAAITGHLVLSTLHTNNALATLERLFDMGVKRYMVATSVVGIVSQRLIRTLCPNCRKLRKTTKYERYMFARVLHKKVKETYEAVGCDECHGGYKGRMAIHEVLYISERIRDMISNEELDKEELRDSVYSDTETTTLLQDALQKVLSGQTTFQEVHRVVDIDIDLDNAIKSDMGVHEKKNVIGNVEEDEGWEKFDGVFDDELELIDASKKDITDLPIIDTSVINVADFAPRFNKDLEASDPEFIKFFLIEDEKIKKENNSTKAKENEIFDKFLKQYDESQIDNNSNESYEQVIENEVVSIDENTLMNNFFNDYDKSIEDRKKYEKEQKDDDLIDFMDNDNLVNDFGLMNMNNNKTNTDNFNYNDLLNLIDGYTDINS